MNQNVMCFKYYARVSWTVPIGHVVICGRGLCFPAGDNHNAVSRDTFVFQGNECSVGKRWLSRFKRDSGLGCLVPLFQRPHPWAQSQTCQLLNSVL